MLGRQLADGGHHAAAQGTTWGQTGHEWGHEYTNNEGERGKPVPNASRVPAWGEPRRGDSSRGYSYEARLRGLELEG